MDEPYLMTAIRYVERNPVEVGLAARAEDWPWSSARAHATAEADGLTDLDALAGLHPDWAAMLRQGLDADGADRVGAIEAAMRTGMPLGDAAFLDRLEAATGRALKRRKPGPKPNSAQEEAP